MKYCLWLYEKKAYSLNDVIENFDTDSLSAYFLAGSLVRWLKDIGEEKIAELVGRINRQGDIARQLRSCFGLEDGEKRDCGADFPTPHYALEYHPFEFSAISASNSSDASGSFFGGSFPGSFSTGSGSYITGFGSYNSGIGSFRADFGSFGGTSYFSGYGSGYKNIFFGAGSFAVLFSSGISGSFRLGSGFGFGYGFGRGMGSGGSGSLNIGSYSYRRTASGSFVINAAGTQITEEEYRRTMINLSSCPMNERGYGIHLI